MPSYFALIMTTHLPLISSLFCAFAIGAASAARAAEEQAPVGVFDQHGDIGGVAIPGSAAYDKDSQEYLLSSSGTNMWGDHDEYQFVWRKVKGDFILQASTEFLGAGTGPHRKMGLIVRASLDPKSPHVNAASHGNGLAALQFRRAYGAQTEEIHLGAEGANVLQLERSGKKFTMGAAKFGETFASQDFDGIALPDEVYVGIYICAHNNAAVEKGVFRNVRLIRPAKSTFVPYRDYIGSQIELLDVNTGVRRTIYGAPDSLQAPNWTPDGKRLVYNHNGRMFSLDLESLKSAPIDTGAQIHCNNDHALSFDGKMLGISSGSPSIVYTLPVDGGIPKADHSYWTVLLSRMVARREIPSLHRCAKRRIRHLQGGGRGRPRGAPDYGKGPGRRLRVHAGRKDDLLQFREKREDAGLAHECRRLRADPGHERRLQ